MATARLDELMAAVHGELRRLAQSALLRENAGHTLQPTALVNELYLKLVDQRQATLQDKRHFFGVAASVMRRILIDHARAKKSRKRGGKQIRVEMMDLPFASEPAEKMLAIDQALDLLEAQDERRAHVVKLKFFLGLNNDEVANLLQISLATVERDWALAKAWLYDRMS
jgi:RNA polymerase sigma factor (TIGR02999 family)